METQKDNSGPAFPKIEHICLNPLNDQWGEVFTKPGMTLRDYFAAQALTGYLAYGHPAIIMGTFIDESAKVAYEYADSMLKAREGKL